MKKDIHPKLYTDCVVTCACSSSFVTTSTLPKITVDICSACHPFFTGTQKLIDTEGRVDKFAKRQAAASTSLKTKKQKEEDLKKKKAIKTPKTLKEMLNLEENK